MGCCHGRLHERHGKIMEEVKKRPLPPTAAETRALAFRLLTESFHKFSAEIDELTAYGYGAWCLTELSREAWRCAQDGNPMQFPEWRKTFTKEGPHVNPWPIYWGQWLPDHHLAKFFVPEKTAPVPELDYGQNAVKTP